MSIRGWKARDNLTINVGLGSGGNAGEASANPSNPPDMEDGIGGTAYVYAKQADRPKWLSGAPG